MEQQIVGYNVIEQFVQGNTDEVQSGTTEKMFGQEKEGYRPAEDTVDMLDTQRKAPEVNLDELTQEQRSVV